MEILRAMLLGALQGLTEFLPVSSDGHLAVANYFLGSSGGQQELLFTVLLHLGTLAAVIAVFRRELWGLVKELGLLLRDLITLKFRLRGMTSRRRLFLMLCVSLLPLALVVPVRGVVERLSSDHDIVTEGLCFIFNGVLLLIGSAARPGKRGPGDLKLRDPLWVGLFQALAVLPGVSRSGATISTALLLGFGYDFAVSFSFLMSVPSVLGANVLELAHAQAGALPGLLPCAAGILTAAAVGFFAIKGLRWLVRKRKLPIFGCYCLALGLFVIVAGLATR